MNQTLQWIVINGLGRVRHRGRRKPIPNEGTPISDIASQTMLRPVPKIADFRGGFSVWRKFRDGKTGCERIYMIVA